MPESPSTAQYRALLQQLDRWMEEGRRRHPGVVPCRAGCTACCHGPFDVTVADVELIRTAVLELPAAERAAVLDRARRLLETMRALEPSWIPPYDVADLGEDRFDALTAALAAEPCPLLGDDGRCRIYQSRPLVCRLIGLPMGSRGGRVIENACPIQDRFPAYASLAPQPFALEEFESAEDACLRAAAGRVLGDPERWAYETTIAAVLATLDAAEAR
ncbi:MAG TPA: YkgJ family cysteine cluster protein [Gemmatimonadales bacterium]|nr:YkgJ family cysteine cluster protein [Gemmatimonadales bacterium]